MNKKKSTTQKKSLMTHSESALDVQRKIDKIYEQHLSPKKMPAQSFLHELDDLNPDIELIETDKKIYINAELPGIDAKDIDVQLSSDGYLTISAEKKQQSCDNKDGYYFSECSYGSVYRSIPLPREIDIDHIKAHLKNGVLSLEIDKNKKEKEKIKKISINS